MVCAPGTKITGVQKCEGTGRQLRARESILALFTISLIYVFNILFAVESLSKFESKEGSSGPDMLSPTSS